MSKSPDAFRTISEVSEWLDTPAHVLRFWENRFTQIKPMKRAGGRRYYRPSDMRLIGGIKKLLHDDGVTIRGVQKILREKGIKYVSSLSPTLADPTDTTASDASNAAAKRLPKTQNVSPIEPPSLGTAEVTRMSDFTAPDRTEDAVSDQVDAILNQGVDAAQGLTAEEANEDNKPSVQETQETETPDLFSYSAALMERAATYKAPSPQVAAPGLINPHSTPSNTPAPTEQKPAPDNKPAPAMADRFRELIRRGALPQRDANKALTDLHRRLRALRDRVAGEL